MSKPRIVVDCTEEQKTAWKLAARSEGVTLTDWVKALLEQAARELAKS